MKFYPFTDMEKKRNVSDVSARFMDCFHSFFGRSTHSTEQTTGVRYRLGVTDYLTLGLHPLQKKIVNERYFRNEELIFFFPLTLSAMAAVGAAITAKFLLSVFCAALTTALITMTQATKFLLENGPQETLNATRNI